MDLGEEEKVKKRKTKRIDRKKKQRWLFINDHLVYMWQHSKGKHLWTDRLRALS